jgi:hypothetical protein
MIKIDGAQVYNAEDDRGADDSSDERTEDQEMPAKAA